MRHEIIFILWGNHTSYRGKTLKCTLDSATVRGSTYNFKYDENGIRYKNALGSNMTTYCTSGAPILAENRNGGTNWGTITMEYDYNGLRTRKSREGGVNNINQFYYWQGNKLLAEEHGGQFLYYYYDETGVSGMNAFGNDYFFRKNQLGDITDIYSRNGTWRGGYKYDAYGKVLSLTVSPNDSYGVANWNPFRYRGYYQDQETGFYYLQTRYYDPQNGRFINADEPTMAMLGYGTVMGANLFAYCNNNPVMLSDSTGELAGLIFLGILILIACPIVFKGDNPKSLEQNFLNNTDWYYTEDEAALAWATIYGPMTQNDHKERGTMLLSRTFNGTTYYYWGHTYVGTNKNVVGGFILGYTLAGYSGTRIGWLHSHTAYPDGHGGWDTVDMGPSGADKFLLKLPGMRGGYIVNERGQVYNYTKNGIERYLA